MPKYSLPKDRVFITPSLLRVRYGGDFDPNVFKRWQDRGEIIKIRNGLYLNKGYDISSQVDMYCIANELYPPSYVSLHTALSYYGLIPEQVYEIISVSTRKTKNFDIGPTRYRFHHFKPALFYGYETVPWKTNTYKIASPEKAILDLAYLEPQFSDPGWLEEMRFDQFGLRDDLDWNTMYAYASEMKSETVMKRIALLLEVYGL